jgi:PTS system ascorbate-specific IIA component
MNLSDFLPPGSITAGGQAADWREAVTLAGDLLVAQGVTTDVYTAEMIKAVEDLGPYIVIAPGFALAHARPSPAVLKTGISWVSLAEPVEFGNKENDPVRLVVGLAALDATAHIEIMSALADVLAEDEVMAAAIEAGSEAEIRELLASVVS